MESTDSPVDGAYVRATLIYDSTGEGIFDCDAGDFCWTNFGGSTNTSGNRQFKLLNAPRGNGYQVQITDLTHSSLMWNSDLDKHDFWVMP